MKKARQIVVGILGGALCGVSVLGCYPLVPAFFAALYLERVSSVMLMGFLYIGMIFFMPMTAVVKYGVTILVIAGVIRLIQWANDGCSALMAGGVAAGTTVILSFAGGLLEWRSQPAAPAVLLEGVFVFGAVILLNRLAHGALEWNPAPKEMEQEEMNDGTEAGTGNGG